MPGVTVTLRGVGEQTAETDGAGAFLFTGLHNRDWEIEPTKLGDVFGAVGLADAIRVLQHIVGHDSLDTFEVLACDVTGDGQVTAFDAARIFQFLLGRISGLPVATTCESDWIFVPVPIAVPNQRLLLPQAGACLHGAIAYEPLQSFASAQDFLAIPVGDCTGDWQPPPPPDRDACTYGNTDGNGDADGYPDVHRHRHTYRYPNAEPDRDVHCRHTRGHAAADLLERDNVECVDCPTGARA